MDYKQKECRHFHTPFGILKRKKKKQTTPGSQTFYEIPWTTLIVEM